MVNNKFLKYLCGISAMFLFSCSGEEIYSGSTVIEINSQIFIQNAKANTVGGKKATVVNSHDELVAYVGELAETNTKLKEINFQNSTFIFDSDTMKYVVRTDFPNPVTTYMVRGMSGNYAFQYYIETQKSGNESKDAKRPYIIGVVVDKLPADAEVYVSKDLNFIDSTVVVYPKSIENIPHR